ncbi:hypothetical protein BGZ63DRAFT_393315 [Mariannaea sp. PMI_226]|nr:hypothetical protein BGZ63DRAFT_393315 [Mariannaea sp. PMI_226]
MVYMYPIVVAPGPEQRAPRNGDRRREGSRSKGHGDGGEEPQIRYSKAPKYFFLIRIKRESQKTDRQVIESATR